MSAIPAEPSESLPIKALALAIVIGLLGASLATFFMWLIEEGQVLFFTDLPQAFGWDAAPAWWITGGLLLSALLIIAAQRLPGHTGEGPLTGFHFNDPVRTCHRFCSPRSRRSSSAPHLALKDRSSSSVPRRPLFSCARPSRMS